MHTRDILTLTCWRGFSLIRENTILGQGTHSECLASVGAHTKNLLAGPCERWRPPHPRDGARALCGLRTSRNGHKQGAGQVHCSTERDNNFWSALSYESLRPMVKFTVKNAVCSYRRLLQMAFLTVNLTLTRTSAESREEGSRA